MNISEVTTRSSEQDPRTRAKLADAAQQFEGMMLQEMLKPLGPKEDSWGGEESSDSGSDTIRSFGIEAVATAISKSGGLGIARQVIQQVTAEHEKTGSRSTESGDTSHVPAQID
ncbi:rod binding protein [Edaphobacter modestus]|uniref:Rod binding protein n=2 Tax=Edaphobacter modestus TaxID=388466 RepID=A0A4V2G450_9BACT|nr:rod binding protein [Edaphobacter modestus]